MAKINKRDKKDTITDLAEQIVEESKKEIKKKVPFRFDKVVRTGSTLLDLNISGGRVRGGGIPGGVLAEIYGGSGSGKTSLLASICANAQHHKGNVDIQDPESRLDKEYMEIYNVNIKSAGFGYSRPDTVLEAFTHLRKWYKELSLDVIHVAAIDAVAALSTELEMDNDEGDKRGQKQAKEFSQNLRKTARILGGDNIVTIFNNQVRQGENGEITPCGIAMEFYGSLRMRVQQKQMIDKTIKLSSGKEVKKIIGIESQVYVKKSTVDDPYRSCPLSIIFGSGIDDIRDQLQWYKDMTKETRYDVFNGKFYVAMDKAILHIEENNLQKELRERTINLWEEIEAKFDVKRSPKVFW
jgi:protein RecA